MEVRRQLFYSSLPPTTSCALSAAAAVPRRCTVRVPQRSDGSPANSSLNSGQKYGAVTAEQRFRAVLLNVSCPCSLVMMMTTTATPTTTTILILISMLTIQ